jgi:hypothetical protein
MCVKRGCPDNNFPITEDWQQCTAMSYSNAKNYQPLVPNVSDSINEAVDLALMGENLRLILLNGGLIIGCGLVVLLILGYNFTLRSRPIKA